MMALTLTGVSVFMQGCKKTADEENISKTDSVALCIKCGQIKGSDLCCKPDQAKCDGCGDCVDSGFFVLECRLCG